MEENLLRHPEIVNPYDLGSRSFNDKDFVKDLSSDVLLNSVPFFFPGSGYYSSGTRNLAYEVIVNLDSDDSTIRYRQNALEELIRAPDLRKKLQNVVKGMGKIREKFSEKNDLGHGVDLLRTYRDFMQNLPDLNSTHSEAITTVNNYLNRVKTSNEFSEICEFIHKIENLVGVDFRVLLDKNGNPFHMTPIELVEKEEQPKKPIFARLLEKKKTEQTLEANLRNSWGLNELGKIIEEYMNKQFPSSIIQTYTSQISEVTRLLEPLDFYRGFADYFVRLQESGFDISRPVLLPKEERRMSVRNARNPLLMETRNNGHRVVPNDIEYNRENNIFVITEPNNGGKTTYVKTVGLIQLMAQSGLFVPAKSAEVSFVDGIYTHFIAPDDITMGEGRYRNELRRMKDIFEKATPYSLVILDEPCGGTSYEEGQRQSLVLLDGFHKLGSATYFTTHMHPLTKEVDNGRYPAGRNLQVKCIDDGEKIKYTYRVIPGSSGKSYGEEIAREIGLRPENIMDTISKRADKKGYKGLLR